MTDDKPDAMNEGAGALSLAPADDVAAWSSEPEFDLPTLAPSPVPLADAVVLSEILADALFGEVIELSDMMPQLLAPGAETAADAPIMVSMTEATAHDTGVDALMITAPFAIFFEEDGSSGHGTL